MQESNVAHKAHNMIDYEQTRREFQLDVPEHFNWARDVIGRWAATAR